MTCNRCHEREATRLVHLSSSVVSLTREFCEQCAVFLCAAPVAGATSSATGIREPLFGMDLGPIDRGN
jgi:protein-arginine kinase activator protein McsA